MIDRQSNSIDKLSDQSTVQQNEESRTDLTMQVDIVLNEPRIALLEDASKPNSRAILLQVKSKQRKWTVYICVFVFRAIFN